MYNTCSMGFQSGVCMFVGMVIIGVTGSLPNIPGTSFMSNGRDILRQTITTKKF